MTRGFSLPQEETRELQGRVHWLLVFIALLFVSLLLRSWYLQAIRGDHYRGLSENNRLRLVPIQAPRGLIYDRSGNLLVSNQPSFNVYLVPQDLPPDDRSEALKRLARYLDVPFEELSGRINPLHEDPLQPIKIKEDLSLKEVARVESHRYDLPGIKIETEWKRHSPYGSLAAHLLGYVGEVSSAQLEEGIFPKVRRGEMVGQYGVERSYDALIRGTPGKKSVEVDVLGHEVRVLRRVEPEQGNDLFLSVDLALQQTAEKLLGGQAGTIVALDPRNGKLLVMVSHPTFDPNVLNSRLSKDDWERMIKHPRHLLNNRAIQGLYPPGSIFKVIMAAAGLETEAVSGKQKIFCEGGMPFGNRFFRDWKRGGHGEVDLHRAIVESCDVYFYDLGNRLGVDAISNFAILFGLGRPTGIDLPSEKAGIIPNRKWKEEARGEPWYPGETLSVSIGQGYVSVTPLQMAVAVGGTITGTLFRPKILEAFRQGTDGAPVPVQQALGRPVPVSEATLATIRKAMEGVVSDPNGTGKAASSEQVSIGGKTATSQVVSQRHSSETREKYEDHAWFVGYAPVREPEIVVVILIEHGGKGGSAAAPLAKLLIEAWHRQRQAIPREEPTVSRQLAGMGLEGRHAD